MIAACASGNLSQVLSLLDKSSNPQLTAALQDESTGRSPLMAAAEKGHLDICNLLLEHGAPWNAVDRRGLCAGNYATDAEHWDIVNLLVDHATKAELILGASMRSMKGATIPTQNDTVEARYEQSNNESKKGPAEWESSTKPDYLERNVRYNSDASLLLDDDDDAVMMEWELSLIHI